MSSPRITSNSDSIATSDEAGNKGIPELSGCGCTFGRVWYYLKTFVFGNLGRGKTFTSQTTTMQQLLASKKGTESASPGTTISHEYWVSEKPKWCVGDGWRATFKIGVTRLLEFWRTPELAGVIRYALKSAENTESGRFSEKPETNAVELSRDSYRATQLWELLLQGAVRFSKPSKALPHFAELLIEPVHKHPDTGAIPDTTKILELLNQWSHLFYTGNGKVPRIITSAAAERLTPCSLELGWKSPVVVDAAFDREFAAKRIL
ncbi:hypothetical protein BKA83DRAFT_4128012 [Pisolithus microcarpus]|nr:hypothetical protein BKA83DRAFT_4128012 [Pisolithus microcarpus]